MLFFTFIEKIYTINGSMRDLLFTLWEYNVYFLGCIIQVVYNFYSSHCQGGLWRFSVLKVLMQIPSSWAKDIASCAVNFNGVDSFVLKYIGLYLSKFSIKGYKAVLLPLVPHKLIPALTNISYQVGMKTIQVLQLLSTAWTYVWKFLFPCGKVGNKCPIDILFLDKFSLVGRRFFVSLHKKFPTL